MHKIDKLLARRTKKKRGVKIRNKRGDITTDTTEIQTKPQEIAMNNCTPTNWTI